MALNLFQDILFSHCSLENTLGQRFLIDNFVDGGLLVARTRHNVLVIRRNVTTQHRRRLLRLWGIKGSNALLYRNILYKGNKRGLTWKMEAP